MKTIERVKMLKTLKAGELIWEAGVILPKEGEPLHPIIIEEVRLNTGSVEVLSFTDNGSVAEGGLKVPLNDNALLKAGKQTKKEDAEKLLEETKRASEAKALKTLFDEIEELKVRSSNLEKALDQLRNELDMFKDGLTGAKKEMSPAPVEPDEEKEPSEETSTEATSEKTKQVRRVVSRRAR